MARTQDIARDANASDPQPRASRRARFRFSLGTGLVLVVVAALDMGAVRRLGEPEMTGPLDGGSYRIPHAYLGALPLADVALVGVALAATRRRRGAPAASTALGFFSLHLALLGGLALACSPEADRFYKAMAEVAVDRAAEGWAAVLGPPDGSAAWFVLACSILGVVLSGPPILVAWLGSRLAVRYARVAPPARFRATAALTSLGFAAAGLAIGVAPHPFEAEEIEATLDVRVIDAATGAPIAGASVGVVEVFPREEEARLTTATTDGQGHARLTGRFLACGEANAFASFGDFSPGGRWLEVAAAGRRPARVALPEVVGFAIPLGRTMSGAVALAPGKEEPDRFESLAGAYQDRDSWGFARSLQVEPDGRFASYTSHCTDSSRVYGRLKRVGDAIEMVPIAGPGLELEIFAALRYREARVGGDAILIESVDPAFELEGWEDPTTFARIAP
ncbi:hypothetical protein [Paludisphaera mucosa]|uniref:Carboxypeptidase regulatory-like domain-containing protein n=1 Tax=Paludisphaera mucosa TaxID=3030827 RepID=A0ABT6FAD6_9BACT|nr:hypothetical protein [Paludisphaera mucosa]MDG3004553.1 hypothetical protein [Paludisphaera mucosa]